MPLLAAAIGVLGAALGAAIGGRAANSGQERGFERQRAAAIQDLQITTYGDFLGTANELVATFETTPSRQAKPYVALRVAAARVAIIAGTAEVDEAAARVVAAATEDPDKTTEEELRTYQQATDEFRDAARNEIDQTAE